MERGGNRRRDEGEGEVERKKERVEGKNVQGRRERESDGELK